MKVLKKKNTAAILVIGNEILSGKTQDININFLAKRLSNIGHILREVRIVKDDTNQIIQSVKNLSKHYGNVFTTGGIGPTHDDITAKCMAVAFKKKLILNKSAHKLLIQHYEKSGVELNNSRLKMAYIPSHSRLIKNSVSAAPGFKIKNVWVMAGVPKIMQAMFVNSIEPNLKKGKKTHVRSIKVNIPEGDIAEILKKFSLKYSKIDIGSYPFYKPPDIGTNIVFRSKDLTLIKKAVVEICIVFKKENISFSID